MRTDTTKSTYKNNHIVRRRAVYTALKSIILDESIYQALWIWEQQYSNEKSMRLRNYISDLAERGLLQGSTKVAYKNLVQSFMQDPSLLAQDPYETMLRHQENNIYGLQTPQLQPKEIVVFEEVVKRFMNLLVQQDSLSIDNISKNITNDSINIDLSNYQKQFLLKWINAQGKMPLKIALSESQMSKILNNIYVIACELVGPIKSDNYLSSAIESAEKLPEAHDYPPHNLL